MVIGEFPSLIRSDPSLPSLRRRRRPGFAEPLITFCQAVMRPAWAQLEQRQAATVWWRQQSAFYAKVAGPHFEEICRDWAAREGAATADT